MSRPEPPARRLARPLSRYIVVAVAIVVAPVLVALVVVEALMVVSLSQALVVAAIVVAAGAVAVVAAMRLARSMIERLVAEEAARDASEAARRDLVAAVSHDLRTPITSLRLLADAVVDELVDGETRAAYLHRMRVHLDALSALIDDLFELSRLEAGDIGWSLQQVPLGELVGETVEAMRVQAERKGVAVRAEIPDALHPARANPEKVQRVLFNLIQNAIRHTPADGSVVVRASEVGDCIEVEVADTGAGIPAQERERVFEAFFRGGSDAAARSGTDGAGAGLGLAVSRAIVEAHGGRIWLAEAPVGTHVRFSLPGASVAATG